VFKGKLMYYDLINLHVLTFNTNTNQPPIHTIEVAMKDWNSHRTNNVMPLVGVQQEKSELPTKK